MLVKSVVDVARRPRSPTFLCADSTLPLGRVTPINTRLWLWCIQRALVGGDQVRQQQGGFGRMALRRSTADCQGEMTHVESGTFDRSPRH